MWTKQKTHEFLKYNCNFEEKVVEDTGEIIRVVLSTTENDTVQQETFHKKCRTLCLEFFGTEIPLPNKELKINFDGR